MNTLENEQFVNQVELLKLENIKLHDSIEFINKAIINCKNKIENVANQANDAFINSAGGLISTFLLENHLNNIGIMEIEIKSNLNKIAFLEYKILQYSTVK